MDKFLEFCGYFLAHAVWGVSDGSILVPFAATTDGGGKQNLVRYVNDEAYEQSAAEAQKHIAEAIPGMRYAAACIDGYFTFDNGTRLDAIHLFGKWNDGGEIRDFMMSLPYQGKTDTQPFKVYKPKLRSFENIDQVALQQAFNSFWDGVDSHTEAAKVWNAALDQSM